MKNNNSIKKTIIPILSVLILVIVLNSCRYSGRTFYKTYTGDIVTIWNDYIIFEKYEGKEPPKDNYIKLIGPYKGEVCMFFKTNDSLIIWRSFDENSMEIALSHKQQLSARFSLQLIAWQWDKLRLYTILRDITATKQHTFYV